MPHYVSFGIDQVYVEKGIVMCKNRFVVFGIKTDKVYIFIFEGIEDTT